MSMRSGDFYWGSNSVALNYSLQLLVADRLRPDARYRDAALENLHYILGRNAFSVSWVTQLGSNPFRRPHHRPSGADQNAEPWPGLLSGGPNPNRNDPTIQAMPALPPMRMWLDHQDAYSANEIAINWNAPLVFVLAAALPDGPLIDRPAGRRSRQAVGLFPEPRLR
jgi:endoglucanase